MIEGQTGGGESPRLRYGMIGGGRGAFIGDVHRKSVAMDGRAELVCGAFSQSYDNTLATGETLGLPRERLYRTFEDMIRSESKRADKPDFISVVTPNSTHYPAAKLGLEHGFSVVCEKPLATTSAEANELACLVRETGLMCCVAYAYSGYPIVKHLRNIIHAGEIGDIRFVNGEYPQEWLATKLEDTGQKQAAWRTDPKLAGASNCVGDIGSHIEFMATYMTGLEIESLCARLDRFGAGRPLDDNATVLVNYKGGAKGVYWSSQIAAGHDNALRLRIYGTKGAVEWFQETPNTARVSLFDRPSGTISRGRDPMSPRAQSLSRLPSGHPEGYFESFANVYSTFIAALAKKLRGEALAPADLDFPSVDDGVRGVRYIEKCVESSAKGAVWVAME
ncbi:MAG TPA: Gfo/Idh/MocA family oxidoreductase [Candidatus Aminicenantes bacterium]|nr:Gfo/Idh/MocA family oxidoreductase [Candidatus Aminicenantes bacterium]